ncbi:hypothetical protein PITC_007030 [Penicillium italicum]|uniref:Uncharacterized protein n=1 Tax=Penicillium italicum TaxID=40296 RepID=A0A0A2KD63_PENIT|nr:hypothetical protein PITC_007030 [Penicillium italicum]
MSILHALSCVYRATLYVNIGLDSSRLSPRRREGW